MRNDQERLTDILETINSLEKYFDKSKFLDDEPFRHGMVNYLTIIGEASRALSEETQSKASNVDWRKVIGFRNKVVHGYFEIDWDIVLEIIEDHIPELKKQIEKLSKQIDD